MENAMEPLSDDDLQIFIDAALEFFTVIIGRTAVADEAHIEIAQLPLQAFTGLIKVNGAAEGVVYVTATRDAIATLLRMLSEDPGEDELYGDLLGELAHTIVSNARAHFGKYLHVAVPESFSANEAPPQLPDTVAYVTQLQCASATLQLVIALSQPMQEQCRHA